MYRKYFVIAISIALVSLSSCVSKKKYLEMEAGRLKAEALSRKLDGENKDKAERIKALIADYEAMKNELLESNAIKDDYIATLKTEMDGLQKDLSTKSESLEETSFNLDFEKQRLSDALKNKDASIKSLQTELSTLENEITAKNSLVDQKSYDIGILEEQAKVLEGKIVAGENDLTKLQGELDIAKAATRKVQTEMETKDAEIKKLQNQVKLLKSQIGQ
jgi:chromosome segregation ATPase